MKTLEEGATIKEIKDFLIEHIDEADDRASKINPVLTKEDIWNINMGPVLRGDITAMRNIIIKNITREFGKHY